MNSPASEFDFDGYVSIMSDLAAECRDDAAFRQRLEADPRAVLAQRPGLEELPEGVDLRVSHNTADTMYLVFPGNPNAALADTAIANVTGGSTLGSAGTASSVATLSCPTGSASSVASGGCAGSAQV